MEKPAPETRNSLGDVVGSWRVMVVYDTVADQITVDALRPGTNWHPPRRTVSTFNPSHLEDALAAVQTAVRTYGARRLF